MLCLILSFTPALSDKKKTLQITSKNGGRFQLGARWGEADICFLNQLFSVSDLSPTSRSACYVQLYKILACYKRKKKCVVHLFALHLPSPSTDINRIGLSRDNSAVTEWNSRMSSLKTFNKINQTRGWDIKKTVLCSKRLKRFSWFYKHLQLYFNLSNLEEIHKLLTLHTKSYNKNKYKEHAVSVFSN